LNVETGPSHKPIGLLVVHGIGRQTKGATASGIIEGLQAAYARRLRVTWNSPDHAVVEGLGPPVHVIEVFWADSFRDEDVRGTFDIDRIFELAWFPGLNWRCGLLTSEIVDRSRVRIWTAVLAVLSPFVWCALIGASLLASFLQGLRQAREERPNRRAWETLRARFSPRDDGGAEDAAQRTLVDDLMDTVVGDIFNYVDGLARSFPDETARTQRLLQSVEEIRRRFEDSARRAVEHGCGEIQIVAHSLGSVIAFSSTVSNREEIPSAGRTARLTRIYTIGSPLGKVRFFWPRLFEQTTGGLGITAEGRLIASGDDPRQTDSTRWDNFYNKLDLVSGRLQIIPGWPTPVNHAVPALGGVLTGHVAYHANPSFLAFLGQGLRGPPPQTRSPRWLRLVHAVLATLQTIAAPLLFVLLILVGLAFFLGLAWGVGWVFAKPFDLFGFEDVATGIRLYMVASIAFVIFGASSITGYVRAKAVHARFWASPSREQLAHQTTRSSSLKSGREE
jgi:hypothetical protein